MTGARRFFFAGLAAFLRFIERAPLGVAKSIHSLADKCEELSR